MKSTQRGVPPFTLVLAEDMAEAPRRSRELTWVPRRKQHRDRGEEPPRDE